MSADSPIAIIVNSTGTNIAEVKAASTAAIATDPALVVAISPNNTPVLPAGAATEVTLTAINTDIDVALSTRASEATLANVDSTLSTALDVVLSTRASEATIAAVSTLLTSELDIALSTRASEATVASIDATLTAQLDTQLSTLLADSTFTGRINTLGQKLMATSTPVVLASDQSAIPVSGTVTVAEPVSVDDNGESLTVDSTQLPAALVGGRLDENVGAWLGSTAPTIGQKVMASSLPVAIASDQTVIPVSDNGGSLTVDASIWPLPTGAATAALQTQPGVDIGDVTINNVSGAGAVNVQDGGNSLTVDNPVLSVVGGGTEATAQRVTIATDSTGILSVDDNGGSLTIDTPQLPATLVGSRLDTNIGAWLGSTAPTVGQKTAVASIPVVLASDVTVSVSTAPSSSVPGFTTGDITTSVIAEAAVRNTTYTEQSSNAQRSIVSSSANDSSAGTGIRTVLVTYYTSTGTGPFTETITMNGVTPVNTVSTTMCFIESIVGVTGGSGGVAAGTISLKAATGGGGATIGSIAAATRQTEWAHHYIPTGKICYITSLWAGHTGTTVGSGCTMILRTSPIGVANALELRVTDKFRLYGQSSSTQRNYGSPIQVAGPARLIAYVTPETATSTNYRASFDYYEL